MYDLAGILLYTRNLNGADAGYSFVRFTYEKERTNKRELVLNRLHMGAVGVMGSVGSDRFHGEGLRGQRVTYPNLPNRTHRPYKTHKNPT